jgi:hypothetical protein
MGASGIFGGAANTIYDGAKDDWSAVVGDLAAVGMDLLGFVTNPLGSLLSAGIGWLIEHIGFLKGRSRPTRRRPGRRECDG